MLASLCLHDVSVEFPIYSGGSRSLKKLLLHSTTQGNLARDARDHITVRALSGITIDVKHGDRLAIIGSNGAGKSTLLKVLAGIYAPTGGRMYASGRVSALLTASIGLNPDATGRENIIIRGIYMDVHPRNMRARVDEISEFTELGSFIDMPVRTYSAGMMVRLCFAVATSLRPEILCLDEFSIAIDPVTTMKIEDVLLELKNQMTIVLVTNLLQQAQRLADQTAFINASQLVEVGPTEKMFNQPDHQLTLDYVTGSFG